jgi:hypothetical protein
MRYFKKLLCQTFNKIMKDIKQNIMNPGMNMTKARLYKALKSNNQTRKKFNHKKRKLFHTNSIKIHNKQFNLRHNTIKNYSI